MATLAPIRANQQPKDLPVGPFTPEEAWKLFDDTAWLYMDMPGEQFLSMWEKGNLGDVDSRPQAMRVISLIPLVRQQVPGRNPAEAVREYLEPLQQSLSCLSEKCILRPSGYGLGCVLAVTLSQPSAELITKGREILHLAFVQQYSIVEPRWPFRFKIRARAYFYGLEDRYHNEIIAYHWHPETSRCQFPHFHVGKHAIGKVHFPTGRIAFEEFCQLLITEFEVVPECRDATEVLARNLQKFKDHKTW